MVPEKGEPRMIDDRNAVKSSDRTSDPTNFHECCDCKNCLEAKYGQYRRRQMPEPAPLTKILEERGGTYGPFIDNAVVAQNMKHVIDNGRTAALQPDMEEAIDMFCSKLSRIITGDPEHIDNWDDIAGFATLVANRLRKVNDAKAVAKKA